MSDRTRIYAGALDRERRRDYGDGARMLMLQADGSAQRYKTLLELPEAWAPKFPEDSEEATFKIARDDDEFNSALIDTSNIIIVGSEDGALNNQLFEVNRGTTLFRAGSEPVRAIRAKRTGKRFKPA